MKAQWAVSEREQTRIVSTVMRRTARGTGR